MSDDVHVNLLCFETSTGMSEHTHEGLDVFSVILVDDGGGLSMVPSIWSEKVRCSMVLKRAQWVTVAEQDSLTYLTSHRRRLGL